MPEDRRETGRAIAHWRGQVARFGYPPLGPADRDFDGMIADGGAHRFIIGIARAADDHLLLTYGPQFARLLGLPARAGSNIRLLREIPVRLLPTFVRGCREVARHAPPVQIEGVLRLGSGRRQLFRAVFMPLGTDLVFGAFNSRLSALEQRKAPSARDRHAEWDAIAAFIRRNGVTRCPTAFAIPTRGAITAADREALERYAVDLDQSRQRARARQFTPDRD